ncbi:hypothetical protein [uncultured Brachyspira sp.]|uniref:hypothetical protein n=1 Tax=uncultured Brachyspira sp. TaxID=221953 RepID=UPI0026213293|nr:hypothetical protein [uncultured Brachyspira sp.]
MAFYEDMYYSLPENERETFINSLSEEDRQSLMLSLKKNDLYSNVSNNQKERFESIYKELKDEKTKKSFIDIFNYLDEDKREILLDIVSNNINDKRISEEYNNLTIIADIFDQYKEKLNKFLNLRKFRRILQFIIDIKIIEVVSVISQISYNYFNNSLLNIYSLESKYNYYKNNNEKLLNMLYKFPEEKIIYFFEEFEKNSEFKDSEFIKMFRVVLNMDRDLFLYIFKNVKEADINNVRDISYAGAWRWGTSLSTTDEKKTILDYLEDSYNYSRIIDIYKCFQSKIESFFFLRIFESIVNFQTKKLIDIFESLDENMQESVNHFSSIVVLEKLEDYINLFSNVSNKSEKNAKETQINDNEFTYNNNATSIDNDIYIEYLSKCKAKLTEISWLIEDFEHAIKEDYKKSCKEIDSVLDRGIENKEKFNKIIEHINNIYKNAYYKKHNKSSLAYIMDDEDENIKYIEYIN